MVVEREGFILSLLIYSANDCNGLGGPGCLPCGCGGAGTWPVFVCFRKHIGKELEMVPQDFFRYNYREFYLSFYEGRVTGLSIILYLGIYINFSEKTLFHNYNSNKMTCFGNIARYFNCQTFTWKICINYTVFASVS